MTGEELQRDASVVIALWLLIHGGDPPLNEVDVNPSTGILAAALVGQLARDFPGSGRPLSDAELHARLGRIGVQLTEPEPGGIEGKSERPRFNGFFCVRGPEGEPGCCVRLGVAFQVNEDS